MGTVRSLRDRIANLERRAGQGAAVVLSELYTAADGTPWIRFRWVSTGAVLEVPEMLADAECWAATYKQRTGRQGVTAPAMNNTGGARDVRPGALL